MASPTPFSDDKYAAKIFQVRDTGQQLHEIREVVTGQDGVEFVRTWSDAGFAVLGSPSPVADVLHIVNLRRLSQPLTLRLESLCEQCVLLACHFAKQLDGRPSLRLEFSRAGEPAARTIDLETALPIQDVKISAELFSDGIPTPAIKGDFFYVNGRDFSAAGMWAGVAKPALFDGDILGVAVAYINNKDLLVLTSKKIRTKEGLGMARYAVYYKPQRVWHEVTFPGGRTDVRSFGEWLGGAVAQEFSDKSASLMLSKYPVRTTGSSFELRSDIFHLRALGRLVLYNARTKAQFEIVTGKPDSEFLGVFDGSVYYRIEDRLLAGKITPKGVTDPVLIIRDPAVLDMHWLLSRPR